MTIWGFDITWWVLVGLVGQGLFFMRFVVQWVASERAGRSVIPVAFWYFSILGAIVIFAYALHRNDPVFILGQLVALVIYARNLVLIRREQTPRAEHESTHE